MKPTMNIATLRQRLERLEATNASVPTLSKPDPLLTVLQVLIAHYLGDAGPTDSIAEAMARGLGYGKGHALRTALRADWGTSNFEDLRIRWLGAMRRLFAVKETTPDCDGPTFGAVVKTLFFEMPEHLQRHPVLVKSGAISEAA